MRPSLHDPQDLTFLSRLTACSRGSARGIRPPALLEPFRKLKRQQFAEQASHTHAGVVIAATSDNVLFPFVISRIWTIECQFHEARKGNGAFGPYLSRNSLTDLTHLLAVWCGSSYESFGRYGMLWRRSMLSLI